MLPSYRLPTASALFDTGPAADEQPQQRFEQAMYRRQGNPDGEGSEPANGNSAPRTSVRKRGLSACQGAWCVCTPKSSMPPIKHAVRIDCGSSQVEPTVYQKNLSSPFVIKSEYLPLISSRNSSTQYFGNNQPASRSQP
jgi:hypothetical protein